MHPPFHLSSVSCRAYFMQPLSHATSTPSTVPSILCSVIPCILYPIHLLSHAPYIS
jgi:hypothetical protein